MNIAFCRVSSEPAIMTWASAKSMVFVFVPVDEVMSFV
jgi:hypothetical protein